MAHRKPKQTLFFFCVLCGQSSQFEPNRSRPAPTSCIAIRNLRGPRKFFRHQSHDSILRDNSTSPRRSQRGRAATKTRSISRKGAKAAKVGKNLMKSFETILSSFRTWRLCAFAGTISDSECFQHRDYLRRPRKFWATV